MDSEAGNRCDFGCYKENTGEIEPWEGFGTQHRVERPNFPPSLIRSPVFFWESLMAPSLSPDPSFSIPYTQHRSRPSPRLVLDLKQDAGTGAHWRPAALQCYWQ